MSYTIHSQARTTSIIRREIRDSKLTQKAQAKKYGITRLTIRKWQAASRVGRKTDLTDLTSSLRRFLLLRKRSS